MFDASGMQSADFEEEDIDVFSELGVANYTISNSVKADDVLSALMDDDDEEIQRLLPNQFQTMKKFLKLSQNQSTTSYPTRQLQPITRNSII